MTDEMRMVQAQLLGQLAALTLMADHHPNRAAVLAAAPATMELVRMHQLFSDQPDWMQEIALSQIEGCLRMPRQS